MNQPMLIGIDTGGTFTDFIYRKGPDWHILKVLSTPADPAEAVLEGIRQIAGDAPVWVVHGSTVATNAILEKKGAVTALVTNRGFEDVIEIGRQHRSQLYDLFWKRSNPPIPSRLRFGIDGRISAKGEQIHPLNTDQLEQLAGKLLATGVESVAVSFLFSFLDPAHEKAAGAILSKTRLPVSLSHEILAEFREYERTATTVINAYVAPKIARYISTMTDRIPSKNLRIMQSNGGSISAETACREPVRTILSGPAGGVVGARVIGHAAGYDRLITFDMGGTSTDVALIDRDLPITTESSVGGFPVRVPMIDIHTVGAGGGSIAATDAGGALTVGPQSAGADPGPICYGKGEQITVTDANLFLGRLLPDHFLGGGMHLDSRRISSFFEKLAADAGLSPAALAGGVLDVANAAMEKAIRVISVEKGHDPGQFTLFSFGGAGGLHAAFLARLLRIPRVLIPKNPGILSAYGMLTADVIRDYSRTVMMAPETPDARIFDSHFASLEALATEDLAAEMQGKDIIRLERYLDMRYRGQSYELIVPCDDDVFARFHRHHQRRYGYSAPDRPVEVVNLRLRAVGEPEKPAIAVSDTWQKTIDPAARIGRQGVFFEDKMFDTDIFKRDRLESGNQIAGPALIIEYSSTIVIPPFAKGEVDRFGNLVIDIVE